MSDLSPTDEIDFARHVAVRKNHWNELPVQEKLFMTNCSLNGKLVIITPKISHNAPIRGHVALREQSGQNDAHLLRNGFSCGASGDVKN